jgi:splicing factor 3B subunit 3
VQISLVYDNPSQVTELKVKYFDTIPPCSAMCILKTGFLFAASEIGDHGFYEFLDMGQDDGLNEASSKTSIRDEDGFQPIFFEPQPLKNLQLMDVMMSLAPMTDMKVENLLDEVCNGLLRCLRRFR